MPPKLTQPLRPAARYRKGQGPVGAPASDSDSDQEDEQLEQPQSDAQAGSDDDVGVQEFTSGGNQRAEKGKAMGIKLDKVQVDQQGKVKVGGKDEVGRTEMESSEGEYGKLDLRSSREKLYVDRKLTISQYSPVLSRL